MLKNTRRQILLGSFTYVVLPRGAMTCTPLSRSAQLQVLCPCKEYFHLVKQLLQLPPALNMKLQGPLSGALNIYQRLRTFLRTPTQPFGGLTCGRLAAFLGVSELSLVEEGKTMVIMKLSAKHFLNALSHFMLTTTLKDRDYSLSPF